MSLDVDTVITPSWTARAGHRLVFDPRGSLLCASRQCEADVFLSRFGNTREQLELEYSAYADQSLFVSLVDDEGDVLATARLITPGAAGLKTIADCSAAPWKVDGAAAAESVGLDLGSTWDVATISARGKAGRNVLASAALYHGLILTARANDVSATVAVLDERVRGLLGSVGLFYRPLPGTWAADYLGSAASTPVYAQFGSMLDEQKRKAPEGYRLVTLGIGLDDVHVPPVAGFRRRSYIDLRPVSATQASEGEQVRARQS